MPDDALERFLELVLGPVEEFNEPVQKNLVPFYANAYKKEKLWEPTSSR